MHDGVSRQHHSPRERSLRRGLLYDADAWGFGVHRAAGVGVWTDRDEQLLHTHAQKVEASMVPLVLALLAPVFGRPLYYLRQRWQQEQERSEDVVARWGEDVARSDKVVVSDATELERE